MKNKRHIYWIVPAFFLLLGTDACKKIEFTSEIPEIHFISAEVKDTIDILDNPVKSIHLVFELKDGDGDIGLNPEDTSGAFHPDSLYYHNLFLTEFIKLGDRFEEITDALIPKYYRIPYLTPEGQNKYIMAEISVDIDYNYPLKFDELYYTFYVADRAFHHSNTDTSSVISLKPIQ